MHTRPEVDDDSALLQQHPVLLCQYRTPAGGQNHVIELDQAGYRCGLTQTEARLAFNIKYVRDVHTGALLDFLVAVHEFLAQMPGQCTSHRSFSRSHHAHQDQVTCLKLATMIRVIIMGSGKTTM